jgi:HEAT repeat protein
MSKGSFKLELRVPRVRGWLERSLAHLVQTVRERPWHEDVERIGARVQKLSQALEPAQRFGDQAWQMIAARWPALSELVRERKIVSARYRPPKPEPTNPALSFEAIDAMLAQLNASPSWQVRRSAALSLGHVEAAGVVPALVRALRDSSVEVAVSAVDGLSSHHERDSTDALLAVLQNADGFFSPVTRVAAIAGLARRLGPDELEPLFAAVRDLDAEVSIAAIAVVAERAPARAREQLSPILRDQSGFFLPVVRLAAANALERSGSLPESLALELAQAEGDPAVRRVLERARYVLGRESAVT